MTRLVSPTSIAELNACHPDDDIRLSDATILTSGGGEEGTQLGARYLAVMREHNRKRRRSLAINRLACLAVTVLLYALLLYLPNSLGSLAVLAMLALYAWLLWKADQAVRSADHDIETVERMFSDDYTIKVRDLRVQLASSGTPDVKVGPWDRAVAKPQRKSTRR